MKWITEESCKTIEIHTSAMKTKTKLRRFQGGNTNRPHLIADPTPWLKGLVFAEVGLIKKKRYSVPRQ